MFNYTHKVQYYETDKMGITHHSNYIRFMEEARNEFLNSIGWGYGKMEENGLFSPVVSLECNFKKSTTFDDKILIELSILEVGQAKMVVGYTMSSGGETVCTAKSCHCFVDANGRPIAIKKASEEFFNLMLSLALK